MSLWPAFEQLSLFDFTVPRLKAQTPAPTQTQTPSQTSTSLRHVQLGARVVSYTLRQGQGRRRLSLMVDDRGLLVGAPIRTRMAHIDAFIQTHATWVLEKLAENDARNANRHFVIQNGARLPWLGGEIELRLSCSTGAGRSQSHSHWHDDHLMMVIKEGTGPAELGKMIRRAVRRRALSLFETRLHHYAQQMGLPPPVLGLSSARTRWGSCSLKSGIRINWRLIHLSQHLIDYVIVHELAHLIEMNHSPRFWAVVSQAYPDWRKARDTLKVRGREIPLL